jgi:hypothetical protein
MHTISNSYKIVENIYYCCLRKKVGKSKVNTLQDKLTDIRRDNIDFFKRMNEERILKKNLNMKVKR